MLIDHFKDEMIRSICKAGGRGRGGVRVSTALLLLVGVAAAATAAAAQHPCNPDDPIAHLPLGSRWHEYKEGYQAHNRTDLRSYEAEKLLEDGIVCVDQRLQAIGEAIGQNNTLLEQRRTELTQLLTVVSSTLSSLSEQVKTLRPIKVDVHTHSDGALNAALVQQLLNTLVSQNAILTKIQSTLAVSGATPAINVNAIAASSSMALEPRADSAPRAQIEPSVPVATYYDPHATQVDFAIASIPDPRVPRHRRQYDNAIAAISQGMLIDGFVLDKFAFPWAKDLLPSVGSESKDDPNTELKVVDDPRYGLMLFRHDSWREASAAPHQVEIRALYVVTETGTYGVQPAALASAIAAIDEQWPAPAVAGQPVVEPLVLFGPTFSGSMNSIREILLKRASEATLHGGSAVRSLHLVSPSATVESNKRVGVVSYDTLARSDTEKLEVIEKIRGKLNVDPEKVAIVYESTTFGIEACKNPGQSAPAELAICAKALKVPLPVNIADVRYGLRLKAATKAQAGELQTLLPADVVHLSLEQGAENGSEFPESQQSPITAASTDLELKRLIAALSAGGAKLIVVIATDVRDRLFLIEQIASRLDGALYVDLGADRLLGHPDFIHATRGMLTLSSSRLTTVFADRNCFKQHPEGVSGVVHG